MKIADDWDMRFYWITLNLTPKNKLKWDAMPLSKKKEMWAKMKRKGLIV